MDMESYSTTNNYPSACRRQVLAADQGGAEAESPLRGRQHTRLQHERAVRWRTSKIDYKGFKMDNPEFFFFF